MDSSHGEGIGDATRAAGKHSPGAILGQDTCCQPPPLKKVSKEPRGPPGLRGLLPL